MVQLLLNMVILFKQLLTSNNWLYQSFMIIKIFNTMNKKMCQKKEEKKKNLLLLFDEKAGAS